MGGNLVDNPGAKNRRFLVAFDYDSTIREVKDMIHASCFIRATVKSLVAPKNKTLVTALWKVDFGFNEFRLCHFFRILECFNMRYISDISYARIMKYGNPDIYFLRFF